MDIVIFASIWLVEKFKLLWIAVQMEKRPQCQGEPEVGTHDTITLLIRVGVALAGNFF
jgi:hypothetical protein